LFQFLSKEKQNTSVGNVAFLCSDPGIIVSCTPSRNSAGILIKNKKIKNKKNKILLTLVISTIFIGTLSDGFVS